MTHMSHRSRRRISPRDGHGASFVTHTLWSCAPQSCCGISTTAILFLWRADFQPACRLPRCRRQVMDAAAGAQDGRLPHGLARRPPRPRPIRRSALPRRVMRAKALPDRVQAPLGLSGGTRGARSPPSDQPRRGLPRREAGFEPADSPARTPDPAPARGLSMIRVMGHA